MHSVDEALLAVLRRTQTLSLTTIPVAVGRVLAESIVADADAPPFDKAMMDGFAVQAVDATTNARLAIVDEVSAGRVSTKVIGSGQAIRIMTGAPTPCGADAVVMIEDCTFDDTHVVILKAAVVGQHIQPRGKEMRTGETILQPGTILRPAHVGLLAAVGRTEISAYGVPRVAIISTGDELVEAGVQPAAGQIRNSNGPMLIAQVLNSGAIAQFLGIARDTRDDLQRLIGVGMQCDVVILSGGVSAGKLDLVPEVLADLGVEAHVHKVVMKPGKPLYFGTRGETLFFGLPGNPLSSFVGFELFVAPALRKLMGHVAPSPHWCAMPLGEPVQQGNRPTYHPSKIVADETVVPLAWKGSADLRRLCDADSLSLIPAGEGGMERGHRVQVLRLTK